MEESSRDRKDPDFVKVLMRDVLADVGPSMLMSSTCQTVCLREDSDIVIPCFLLTFTIVFVFILFINFDYLSSN